MTAEAVLIRKYVQLKVWIHLIVQSDRPSEDSPE